MDDTRTPKARRHYIPADLMPQVIERIRQLNEQGVNDRQIGLQLGYGREKVRILRIRYGIEGIAGRMPGSPGRPPTERACPTCTQPVDINAGVIPHHKALLGRAPNGVWLAQPCPASKQLYAALVAISRDYINTSQEG